jgi:radical SAM superfamily enzyme YgiQ (UPF0313 family)
VCSSDLTKVLFISFFSSYPALVAAPLMGAYALKTFAQTIDKINNNYEIEIANFSVRHGVEKALKKISQNNYRILVFSCCVWNMPHIIDTLSKISKYYIVIFGGPEICKDNLHIFKEIQNRKFAVIGEGEENFAKLLLYLHNRENKIDFEEKDSFSILKSKYPLDLTNLPSVYKNNSYPIEYIRHREVSIETQRGCLYNCSYCDFNKGENGAIRYFPLERVFDDIESVVKNEPYSIYFIDAMFASDYDRAKKILLFSLDCCQNLQIFPRFRMETSIFTLKNDLIDIISRFKNTKKRINNIDKIESKNTSQWWTDMMQGYNFLTAVGIQSFNKDSLAAVNRPYLTIDKFIEFMKICKDKNIVLKVDLMLALPYETIKSYFECLDIVVSNLFETDHFLAIALSKMIPRTKLWTDYNKYGIKINSQNHDVVCTNSMSKDEVYYAKCITAILCRIVNSPIRNKFIKKCDSLGFKYSKVTENIFNNMKKENTITDKIKDKNFNDDYWFYEVFSDLPHNIMLDYINKM